MLFQQQQQSLGALLASLHRALLQSPKSTFALEEIPLLLPGIEPQLERLDFTGSVLELLLLAPRRFTVYGGPGDTRVRPSQPPRRKRVLRKPKPKLKQADPLTACQAMEQRNVMLEAELNELLHQLDHTSGQGQDAELHTLRTQRAQLDTKIKRMQHKIAAVETADSWTVPEEV